MDASKQKPNLMPTPGAATDHGKRILAALEHGGLALPAARATRRNLDGLTTGLGVALVLLSVMAWIVYDNAKSPPLRSQDTAIGAQQSLALPAGAQASVRPTPQSTQSEQAAAIVNEPAAEQYAAQHRVRVPPPAAAIAEPSSAVVHTAAGAVRSSTPAPMTRSAQRAPEPPASAQHMATAILPTAAVAPPWIDNRPSSKAAAAPRKVATSEPLPPATPSDSDITLLTAMIAHANGPVVVAPERTRDVVERHDGDSTESLLGRCKLLGTIEAMLCRSRICAGRWDSDAACRAPSH